MDVHKLRQEDLNQIDAFLKEQDDSYFEEMGDKNYYEMGRYVDQSVKAKYYRLTTSAFDTNQKATKYFIEKGRLYISAHNHRLIRQMSPLEGLNPKITEEFKKIFKGCEQEEDSPSHPYVQSLLESDYLQGLKLLPKNHKAGPWQAIDAKMERLSGLLLLRRPQGWIITLLKRVHPESHMGKTFVKASLEVIDNLKKAKSRESLLPHYLKETKSTSLTKMQHWIDLDRLYQQYVVNDARLSTEEFISVLSERLNKEKTFSKKQLNKDIKDLLAFKSFLAEKKEQFATEISIPVAFELTQLQLDNKEIYEFTRNLIHLCEKEFSFSILIKDEMERDQLIEGFYNLILEAFKVKGKNKSFQRQALSIAIKDYLARKLRDEKNINAIIKSQRARVFRGSLKEALLPYIQDAQNQINELKEEAKNAKINPGRILLKLEEMPMDILEKLCIEVGKALIIEDKDRDEFESHIKNALDDVRPIFANDPKLVKIIQDEMRKIFDIMLFIDLASVAEGDGFEFIKGQLLEYGKQARFLGDYLERHPFDLGSLPRHSQRMGLITDKFCDGIHELYKKARGGPGSESYEEMKKIREGLGTASKILKLTPEIFIKMAGQLVHAIAETLVEIVLVTVKDEKAQEIIQYMDEDLVKVATLLLDDVLDRHNLKFYVPLLEAIFDSLDPSPELEFDRTRLAKEFNASVSRMVIEITESQLFGGLLKGVVLALRKASLEGVN
jgi:hypothetical protein